MKKLLPYYSKTALTLLAGLTLSLGSCKKDDDNDFTQPEISSTKGVYMLCEGGWHEGNGDITYYNINTGTTEVKYYKKVNGTNLGETANDLQRYGSKMYCVVTGQEGQAQSFVDVMDVATCKTIKRISFNTSSTNGTMPRSIVFYQNKAYVSRYDGKVSRIDTGSLAIEADVTLSPGLEGMAVANGKLYVANSANSGYPGKQNVVSVIDLGTFTKKTDIVVNKNPVKIAAASNGDLFVVTWYDFATGNPASLDCISSVTDTKTATYPYDLGTITINNNKAYVSKDIYSNPSINPLNLTGTLGNTFIADGTKINNINGLTVNGFNNDVYVGDAVGYSSTSGKAYCFSADGKIKFSFNTAGNPKTAVFIYNYKQ